MPRCAPGFLRPGGRAAGQVSGEHHREGAGQGVKQDYEKAVYWFRKGAEQGSGMAIQNPFQSATAAPAEVRPPAPPRR